MFFSPFEQTGDPTFSIVPYIPIILFFVMLYSYVMRKKWSLVMSVVSLSVSNFLMVALVFLDIGLDTAWFGRPTLMQEAALIAVGLWLFLIFSMVMGSIFNANFHSKNEQSNAKALWLKINQTPTEQDNTLFRMGCAIAAVVMGVSLFMPMFSVNVSLGAEELSARFTIIGLANILDELLPVRFSDLVIFPIIMGMILIGFYIIVLFCISFMKSKLVKTVMGLQLAISIAICVFVARAAVNGALNQIEEALATGSTFIDGLGIPQLLFGSIGGGFGSLFRLEFGVWMLLGSLAAYILFASCHFSSVKMPGFAPMRQQVVKIRCLACGNLVDEAFSFCNICGQAIRSIMPNPAPAAHGMEQQQAGWTDYEHENHYEQVDVYQESYQGQERRRQNPEPYYGTERRMHESEFHQRRERRRANPEPYRGTERRMHESEFHQRRERRRVNPEPFHGTEKRRAPPEPHYAQDRRRQSPEPYHGQERRTPRSERRQASTPQSRGINPIINACLKCGTTFLEGMRYCDVCGASRRRKTIET